MSIYVGVWVCGMIVFSDLISQNYSKYKLTNFSFEDFKYFNHQTKSNSSSASNKLNSTQTTELGPTQLNLLLLYSNSVLCQTNKIQTGKWFTSGNANYPTVRAIVLGSHGT